MTTVVAAQAVLESKGTYRSMLRLAGPTVLSYLAVMFLGLVDLVVCGRHSSGAVAAAGMGNAVFTWAIVTGIGLLAGLDYLVSHSNGAGNPEAGFQAWLQSHWLSAGTCLVVLPSLYLLADHLDWIGIHPDVIPGAAAYLRVVAPSLIGILVFQGAWQYLRGHGVVAQPLWILLGMNVVNGIVNYAWVLGNWGFPRLGAEGAAWATLLVRTAGAVAVLLLLWRHDRAHHGFLSRRYEFWSAAVVRRLLALGVPAAGQMMLEVGVFALATALAARFAPVAQAAHHIALNLASMTFMVPMGVGAAASVLVGNALGRGARAEAAATGWRALTLALMFMSLSSLVLFVSPRIFVSFYSTDVEVLALGVGILQIAAVFQLADGAQVVLTGALRGWADTRGPMVANLLGHWAVGLPLGIYLGFYRDMGIRGIWIGLALGLVCVALGLVARYRGVSRAGSSA